MLEIKKTNRMSLSECHPPTPRHVAIRTPPLASCGPRQRYLRTAPLLPALTLATLAWINLGHSALHAQGLPEPPLTLYGTVTNQTSLGNIRLTAGTLAWRFVPSDGSAPVVLTTQLANINDQFSYRLSIPCESQIPTLLVSSNTLKLAKPPINYDRSQVTVQSVAASLSQPGLGTFILSRSGTDRFLRLDLQVTLPTLDSDGNGLLDEWELRFFGHLGVNPNDDPDHDGMSNRNEMKAGTDPTNAASFFAFTEIQPIPPGGVRLRWLSTAGKIYLVQRSPEILTSFTTIKTGIPATPPINLYTDSSISGLGTYFYRLQIQE